MDIESHLRAKALLALEELSQEGRYVKPRRSLPMRFALAYLWTLAPDDRGPFDAYWRAIGSDNELLRWRETDTALGIIYARLGVKRDEAVAMRLWHEAGQRRR